MNTVLLRRYAARARRPCLITPLLRIQYDYCQYQSNTSTVRKYHLCHITGAVLHYDHYNVYCYCYSVTTTAPH
eukprot:1175241-Pyramimonas_sp.AAC.1